MAAVALDHLEPLGGEALHRALAEAIGAGHLLPHEQALVVGPVEEAWVLDLLMLAYAIEAHRLDEQYVASQRLVVRRGEPALRPVPLIEDEPHLLRIPV